nr:short chain dehydrogenase [Thermoleophilaceae bacterium]
LGTFGEISYAISPKTMDLVLNAAYKIFPDSKAAKKGGKKGELEPAKTDGDKEEKQEEMSTEAVAMAYLMRGVHF